MTKQELIDFETEIKDLFLNGQIKAPIHLSGGNEDALINIFQHIDKKNDWVFSTHRNHYHALLKEISPEWLKQEILAGRSMHINNKKYKFITSSIVCGCLPIAVGVALANKRKGLKNHAWVFCGDMAGEAGMFHECMKYASRHDLPISFIIEDNGLSTNTPTQECWGKINSKAEIIRYKYERIYPHINVGKFVEFK